MLGVSNSNEECEIITLKRS